MTGTPTTMSPPPDGEPVAAAAAAAARADRGDLAAELPALRARLMRQARFALRDPALAEDLVQDRLRDATGDGTVERLGNGVGGAGRSRRGAMPAVRQSLRMRSNLGSKEHARTTGRLALRTGRSRWRRPVRRGTDTGARRVPEPCAPRPEQPAAPAWAAS